jgi:roadblock/LC7 domain-containing protein
MNGYKLKLKLGILVLFLSASGLHAQTGDQKIQDLINTMQVIDDRLELSINLGIGATGYAEVGGVIVDGSLDGAKVTEAMLLAYQDAAAQVLAHDYETATTAEQMFIQNHNAAMNDLTSAIDVLADATSVLMTATGVIALAAEADTAPEQVALQGMIATDEYSIDAAEVEAYNDALSNVEALAQEAGAYLAAANNSALTASIDSYTANNGIVVGTYSALTYTQSVDEFIIVWDQAGNSTGYQGYLTQDFKDAQDIYGASQYILEFGGPSQNM